MRAVKAARLRRNVADSGGQGAERSWSQAQTAPATRMNTSMGEGTPATPSLPWFCLWEIPGRATCQARNQPLCPAEGGPAQSGVQPQNLSETQFAILGML